MNPKQNDSQTEEIIPPIKSKRQISRRRTIAGGLVITFMTFFATSALLLLFALIFAPQLSNALWNTDATQQALYGTSAAVDNAQIIVDMTSTSLAIQASEQQALLDNITQREALLNGRESDLNATDEAITASIIATQTAEVLANEQQRTQAAINYESTQSAINQQSTLIAIEATSTQLALENRPLSSPTADSRPFTIQGDVLFRAHPDDLCNWQGIAGEILNLDGNPIDDNLLQVRILDADNDTVTLTGDNLGLDDSYNWAVQVSDRTNANIYFLRLETLDGTAISPMMSVTFPNSCTDNLAIINFTQIQSFGES